MNDRLNPLRLWTALGLLVLGTIVGAARAGAADGIKRSDLVFVTEDLALDENGCDAASVFDLGKLADTSEFLGIYHGDTHISPGRLAGTSDLSIIMATATNTASFLYLLRMDPSAPRYSQWTTEAIIDTIKPGNVAMLGGITVLPGDREFLVATSAKSLLFPNPNLMRNSPPFQIRKYAIPRIGASALGKLLGAMSIERVGVSMLPTRDGRTVHILTDGAMIHTIDASTLKDIHAPIQIEGIQGKRSQVQGTSPDFIHAELSLDERYLITNRGAIAELSVADLISRTAWSIATSFSEKETGGIAISRGQENHGLLAIHHGDVVAVYRFVPPQGLVELSSIEVPPEPNYFSEENDAWGPHRSINWAGNGSYLVASSNGKARPNKASEFVLIEVKDGGTDLSIRQFLTACSAEEKNYANDILTFNSPNIPPPITPTPAPTDTPPPTITPSPTYTPSPTRTHTPSATPTPSPTSTTIPSTTPSPTPSPTPRPLIPIYLPVILTETCAPGQHRADVLLVIDTSSSMLELTSAGRSKINAAREAAGSFIDLLQLPSDQAGIAWFNETAGLAQPLTGDRAALRAALQALTVHEFTRIDLGVQVAHAELLSPRHRAGNAPVLILLTDGRSNPVPASFAVDAAARAKADGITVFTIGVGRDLDEAALAEMASPCKTGADCPYYFKAPDAEELGAIYRRIAGVIPCGAEAFWGRR